ncbi:MAG TPA: alginate export family protein [Verrucomicrobiae bacterium]|nr:alginate export family protein [Verrucomicrobiae bacterium]
MLPATAAMLASAFVATAAVAQTTIPATETNASSATPTAVWRFDEFAKQLKNPTVALSWGGDFRVRDEYFNNAMSLSSDPHFSPLFGTGHEQEYFRFRGRVWASFFPTNAVTLNLRLAAEPREFLKPAFSDTFFNSTGMQWRYGIVDNFNLQWKKPFDLPATVTVGRQDIFLGDGWLVGDGTPEDGSFTYFLDSLRLTCKLDEIHTTIDAIGILQYARPDAWMPTFGPSGTVPGQPAGLLLTDQDEKGAILWIANKSVPEANVDGYFIYKHDTRLNNPPPADFGDNADIYTFGGRISGLALNHWKYSAEGAYQFGRKQEQDEFLTTYDTSIFHEIRAGAVNSKLTYLFKDDWNDQLSLSYEFLSGDNPHTGTDEMFDVLWGRWPRWSEMYNIYSYVPETRVGQTANLHRIGPTWNVTPAKNLDFSLSYYVLLADEDTPTRTLVFTQQSFTDHGSLRGNYLQAILKYKFNQYVSAHLWSEFLWEGNYYSKQQMMDFLRAEVMFTF